MPSFREIGVVGRLFAARISRPFVARAACALDRDVSARDQADTTPCGPSSVVACRHTPERTDLRAPDPPHELSPVVHEYVADPAPTLAFRRLRKKSRDLLGRVSVGDTGNTESCAEPGGNHRVLEFGAAWLRLVLVDIMSADAAGAPLKKAASVRIR